MRRVTNMVQLMNNKLNLFNLIDMVTNKELEVLRSSVKKTVTKLLQRYNTLVNVKFVEVATNENRYASKLDMTVIKLYAFDTI